MNPLFRNDAPGEFPPSYYAETAEIPPIREKFQGDQTADVAILGAGFCGLWAALTCARAGLKTVVLEAHRAGFGASGRNGGQVSTGYRKDMQWLEQRLGNEKAQMLWDIAQDGKAQLKDFCANHAPDAQYKPGVADGGWTDETVKEFHEDGEYLNKRFGYDDIEYFDKAGFQAIVCSERYKGGLIDNGAGHLHPLNYALALAREVEAAGGTIFELSEVTNIETETGIVMHTPGGKLTAKHGILAGNGYMPELSKKVAARTMPINSFIAATAPLGEKAQEVLTRDIAVADDRFVVNYFRLSDDKRLLFGGRENYSIGFPKDIGTRLRERMVDMFPATADADIDFVWGGTLGITTHRLPLVTKVGPDVMSAGGFSGQGVMLAGMAGRVMAEAVIGQASRFDVLSDLPCPTFPGGAAFRAPLLTLAMAWFSLRDRIGL